MYIPYGTREIKPLNPINLKRFNLKSNEYYLSIARLEPENNVKLIIDEFQTSNSKKKLVIVGPLKNTSYVKDLLKNKSEKVIFTGGVYEPSVQRMLRHNCYAYIHGHEVGGTNPTLVEALSCRNIIFSLNVPFNREVAGESAIYFTKEIGNLKEKIQFFEKDNAADSAKYGNYREKVYKRYKEKYSVQGMVNASADLFNKFVHK